MAFPGDTLALKVELLLNGTWTDVTGYVYTRDPVVITSGRPNEASSLSPASAALTLNNRDGRFSPRNPLGAWYGQIGRNTQLRISAPTDSTQATLAYRFWGEVPAWPARWDVSGRDVYVPVSAAGILRRLNQTTATAGSAMRRWLTKGTATYPAAYWPCEDGSGSTCLASVVAGAGDMCITGTAQLASDSAFACSDALPVIGSSTWSGSVPWGASLPQTGATRFLLDVQTEPADGAVLAALTFGEAYYMNIAQLLYHTGGGLRLVLYSDPGVVLYDSGNQPFGLAGTPSLVSVEFYVDGSSYLQWSVRTLAAGATSVTSWTGTQIGPVPPLTAALPAAVTLGPDGDLGQVGIGHISAQDGIDALSGAASALAAWAGETAGARFTRLCTEEGFGHTLTGTAGTPMGAQADAKFTDLLQEIEDANRGLLYETRDAFGLGYTAVDALYGQSAAVTLDYASAQVSPPLAPTDDDMLTRNDVTVTRKTISGTGSSAEAVATSGPLSTAAPPDGVGVYGYPLDVNVDADSQLADVAGWIAHVGTVDEPRYPVLTVQLARGQLAAIFADVTAADAGSYLAVTNPPSWLPPGDIKQLIYGVTETLRAFTWAIAWNCVPESPYEVAQAGAARADTDGSTLAAGATSAATSLSVASSGTLWTTDAADVPFDVVIGGEQMTVTDITGSSSPQAFTVTRSVNGIVKAHSSGDAVTLALTPVAAL